MDQTPTAFRVAQAVGISGSLWLSGNISALTLISVPALLQSKSIDNIPSKTIVKQWKRTYNHGKAQNPPIAAATAASLFYLAWALRSDSSYSLLVSSGTPSLYISAALLTLGIVPHTLIVMTSTNSKLMDCTEALSTAKDDEIDQLLWKWNILNGLRGLWPLAGGLVALSALLF